MLPFIFIQFFYVPWLERQNRARVPRTVPNTLSGHVIFTHFDHVAEILLDRLKQYGTEHIIVTPELSRADLLLLPPVLGSRADASIWRHVSEAQIGRAHV